MKGGFGFYWRRNAAYYLSFACIAAISSVVAWQLATKVTEEEKVDFLVVTRADSADQNKFQQAVKEHQPSYLYTTNIRFVMPESKEIGQLFGTYGAVEADCFLLLGDILDQPYVDWGSFLPLGKTAKEALGKDAAYYQKDGVSYGVKVHSGVKEGEEAYLFFASTSLHLGPLKADSPYDGAYAMAKGFLL